MYGYRRHRNTWFKMSLTKKELSKNIAKQLEITQEHSQSILDSFINIVKSGLLKEKTVKISAFGSFSTSVTPKRIGRNPKTRESYIIGARNIVKFNASKKIREILN